MFGYAHGPAEQTVHAFVNVLVCRIASRHKHVDLRNNRGTKNDEKGRDMSIYVRKIIYVCTCV